MAETEPTRRAAPEDGAGEGLRTVVVALAANLGIAAAKLVAALLTRSSAMLAEVFHSSADTGNQVLLLVANRRARRPPEPGYPTSAPIPSRARSSPRTRWRWSAMCWRPPASRCTS